MASASELLGQWLTALNAGEWDTMAHLFTSDGFFEEVGTGRIGDARASAAIARGWRELVPDLQGILQTPLGGGRQAMGEVVWVGTHTGSLPGLPASGRPVRLRSVVTILEERGQIRRARHYLDVTGILLQLGLVQEVPWADWPGYRSEGWDSSRSA